jgi:HPt (histidine-containing phosphotransfer) domain-containing protein
LVDAGETVLDPGVRRPRPIVELFLRLGPDELASITTAGDAEALHLAAHKLKGTASILGLRRLATACKELDAIAKQGDFAAGRGLVDGVARDFDATCEALRAELAAT